jgi:hypothetical protein
MWPIGEVYAHQPEEAHTSCNCDATCAPLIVFQLANSTDQQERERKREPNCEGKGMGLIRESWKVTVSEGCFKGWIW